MALQTLDAGNYQIPQLIAPDGYVAAATSTFQLNASGERAWLVLRAPKTGNIDKFAARIQQVNNAPDNGLRFSIQDVDTATGLPDGTPDQSATVASGSVVTGWLDPGTFGASRAVTRGDLLALVIDFPSFVAGDDVSVGGVTFTSNILNFPYGGSNNSKLPAQTPAFAIHYDDSTWVWIPYVYPHSSASSLAFNSGTGTADEWGTAFTLPHPRKISGFEVTLNVSAGANFEGLLYDSDGTTVLATATLDGDVTSAAAARRFNVLFPSDVILDANVVYRVTIRPTTANNVTLTYLVVPNADILQYCWEGGDNLYMTSQLNQGGTWTNYNNSTDGFRRAPMSLMFSAMDDGENGGSPGSPGGSPSEAAEVSHVLVG